MYVCFNGGGGGGAYAFGKIFQPFGHGINFARKDRHSLLRVKTQMLDKVFFSESRGFHIFLQHAFLHMSKQSFGKVLLAQVFLDFGCATFLSGDKPRIFGFIVMKSGPRRWLNTSLLRLPYREMNVGGRKNLGLNWNRRDLYNYNGIHVTTLTWIFQ